MAAQFAEGSPRLVARICGVFYLITIIAGGYAELFVRGSLIVSGDAAATAHNIASSGQLWRIGFAADGIGFMAYIVVTFLLYELLKPVNRGISLLAAFFSLAGCAIGGMSALFHLAALYWLDGNAYLSAFTPAQLQTLAYMSVRMHGIGFRIALVSFGVYCALIGYLVFRSTFMPKTVGVLMVLAGVCYEISMFANFISPPLSRALGDYINLPCLLGEGALTLWLLLFGVNPVRWKQQEASLAYAR
jgi:hypothetical protein